MTTFALWRPSLALPLFGILGLIDSAPFALAGTYQDVYIFQGAPDGAGPNAGVVMDAQGRLYGTTYYGGASDLGIVFRLTPPASGQGAWTEEILHSFAFSDGAYPAGPVVLGSDGSVYGTTSGGGAGDGSKQGGYGGTVFKLANTAGWPITVLHSFGKFKGATPVSGVNFAANGLLYGTTSFISYGSRADTGIIYSVSPLGDQVEYDMAHVFGKGSDGVAPVGLAAVPPASANEFVGATNASANYPKSLGNVYTFKGNNVGGGRETIMYSFLSAPDVSGPLAPPVGGTNSLKGGYYGMAEVGGTNNIGGIYSLTPNGSGGYVENVLYSFGDQRNDPKLIGTNEGATLVQADPAGKLVGATNGGGSKGSGAFFELDPPTIAGGSWTERVDVNFDATDPAGGGAPVGAPLKVGKVYYGSLSSMTTAYGAIYQLTP